MFYLVIATILFIGALSHIKNKPISKIEYVVIALFFILIAGLAYETGVDWRLYGISYQYINPINQALTSTSFFSEDGFIIEPGFAFIASLCKSVTLEFQLLMFCANVLCAFFIFRHLKYYTRYYYLFILLYLGFVYLTLNMSGIRQAIALSIFCYSIIYIKQRNLCQYLLWSIIATSFHISALITLPMYWIAKCKLRLNVVYGIIVIGLIIYLCRISLLNGLIYQITALFNNPFIDKVVLYTVESQENMSAISPKILVYILLLLLFIKYRIKLKIQNQYTDIFLNTYITYIIIFEYFWDTGDIFERLQYYFIISLFVLLPELCFSFKYFINRIVGVCFIYVLSLWSSNPIFFEARGGLPYNPYQNYLLYKMLDNKSEGENRLDEFSK